MHAGTHVYSSHIHKNTAAWGTECGVRALQTQPGHAEPQLHRTSYGENGSTLMGKDGSACEHRTLPAAFPDASCAPPQTGAVHAWCPFFAFRGAACLREHPAPRRCPLLYVLSHASQAAACGCAGLAIRTVASPHVAAAPAVCSACLRLLGCNTLLRWWAAMRLLQAGCGVVRQLQHTPAAATTALPSVGGSHQVAAGGSACRECGGCAKAAQRASVGASCGSPRAAVAEGETGIAEPPRGEPMRARPAACSSSFRAPARLCVQADGRAGVYLRTLMSPSSSSSSCGSPSPSSSSDRLADA